MEEPTANYFEDVLITIYLDAVVRALLKQDVDSDAAVAQIRAEYELDLAEHALHEEYSTALAVLHELLVGVLEHHRKNPSYLNRNDLP